MELIALKPHAGYTEVQKFLVLKAELEKLGFKLLKQLSIGPGTESWKEFQKAGSYTLPKGTNALVYITFVFGPTRTRNAIYACQVTRRKKVIKKPTAVQKPAVKKGKGARK